MRHAYHRRASNEWAAAEVSGFAGAHAPRVSPLATLAGAHVTELRRLQQGLRPRFLAG